MSLNWYWFRFFGPTIRQCQW